MFSLLSVFAAAICMICMDQTPPCHIRLFPSSPLLTHPVPPCINHILLLCEFRSLLLRHTGTFVYLFPPPPPGFAVWFRLVLIDFVWLGLAGLGLVGLRWVWLELVGVVFRRIGLGWVGGWAGRAGV